MTITTMVVIIIMMTIAVTSVMPLLSLSFWVRQGVGEGLQPGFDPPLLSSPKPNLITFWARIV